MMRRGACPTLFDPMATGDGLLVRLPRGVSGLSPERMIRLCDLASRTGNGMLEVTARGNLQLRGIVEATMPLLHAGLSELELLPQPGLAIETNPLAGIDRSIATDAQDLIERLGARLAQSGVTLAPKVSILVDGGGLLPLDEVTADIRLRAYGGTWHLACAGTATTAQWLGTANIGALLEAVQSLIHALSVAGPMARARDLSPAQWPVLDRSVDASRLGSSCPDPIGRLVLDDECVVGLGLPFGPLATSQLRALAQDASAFGARDLRCAPGRSLFVTGLDTERSRRFQARAASHGVMSSPHDPRRFVRACVGKPACREAHIDTVRVATAVAQRLRGAGHAHDLIHISGCDKGCAHPTEAALVLSGRNTGCALIRHSTAAGQAEQIIPFSQLDERIARDPMFESPL